MSRSKKSGAGQPPPNQDPSSPAAHDAAENEGMAHVAADALAGSPDVVARKTEPTPTTPEPSPMTSSEVDFVAEPGPAPVDTPTPTHEPISTIEAPPPFAPAPRV